MKVAIAGTGYVGLVTGVALAHIEHEVTCVDVDQAKVERMQQGICPIYEEGLEELMKKNKERLTYTTDYKSAYQDADVIFIGVGTPERKDGSANLDYVYQVCEQIASSVCRDCTVVVKSTVPIGTNDAVEEYLRNHVKDGIQINVCSNPEFLAQGTAVHDTLYASRIVVGAENEQAAAIMKELYEPLTKAPYNVPYLTMGRRSAEMVKYASNDFLALKISYINEIANFCQAIGANIDDVTSGMGYDSRIGNKFLRAGIGYGGSCFPKDTKALHWLSKANGCELKTIKACIEVNKAQKIILFDRIKEDYDSNLSGKNIAILGVTFKAGTDDLRESPAIDNVKLLLDYGAKVTVYDPVGLDNFKRIFQDKVQYASTIEEAIKVKDIAMIMTDWPEIKNFPIEQYQQYMKKAVIYDGRNCYDPKEMKNVGIRYYSIGR